MRKFLTKMLVAVTFFGVISFSVKMCNKYSPVDKTYYEQELQDSYSLYVAYINQGAQRYGVYVTHTLENVDKVKKMNLTIDEPSVVPEPPDIDFTIYADWSTIDYIKVGDQITKLINSNKCYVYRGDSVFRYNCYRLTPKVRAALGYIDEWSPGEIGFWKIDLMPYMDRDIKRAKYGIFNYAPRERVT